MIEFSIILTNTLFIAALLGLTMAFYARLLKVKKSELIDADLPFVSVIIPARNEEKKIARCLSSILCQDYPNLEVIVIDDRSTDATAEIIADFAARDARIKFVQGKDAPSGWIGKCNALAYAVGHASGEWFVFTDADTWHSTNSVRDAITHAIANRVDLISFVPVQELGSFWERAVMPVLLSSFLLGDPFHTVNDPAAERAYAYGQYIVCRRRSYLAVGGHQSVRDEIVEDHAIGRVFKEKGYKIQVADGRTLYSVRMYTDLESMWQGWTKNLYSLIDSKIIHLVLILLLMNFTVLGPIINLFLAFNVWIGAEEAWHPYIAGTLVALQFVLFWFWYRLTGLHRSGCPWQYYLFIPFGSLAVSALQLHAAYLVLSGSPVNWKGRRYTVNTSKTIQAKASPTQDASLDAALAQETPE